MPDTPHKSDSRTQRELEEVLIDSLSRHKRVQLTPDEIDLGDCRVRVDGFACDDNSQQIIVAEAFTRTKPFESGQVNKVMKDVSKLALIKDRLRSNHPDYHIECFIVLTNQRFADLIKNGDSWKAKAARHFGIEVYFHGLSDEEADRLEKTTEDQAEGMKS